MVQSLDIERFHKCSREQHVAYQRTTFDAFLLGGLVRLSEHG